MCARERIAATSGPTTHYRRKDTFDQQVQGVVNLVEQNLGGGGFDPRDPTSYGLGGDAHDAGTIAVPSVGGAGGFDPAHDPYAASADKVLQRLRALVVNGQVTNRPAFIAQVRAWDANQKALEQALLRNGASQAELGAFLTARNRVTDFLRLYLDAQGWFLDNPVPLRIKWLVDGTYARLFGDKGIQLKDALNAWNGNTPVEERSLLVEVIEAFAYGVDEAYPALSGSADEVKEILAAHFALVSAVTRVGVGFIPLVGPAVDLCEAVSGHQWCVPAGEPLDDMERVISGAGFALGTAPFWGGAAKAATKMHVIEEAVRGAGHIGSATGKILKAPFNPTKSKRNCVQTVIAFLKSVKTGTLVRATEDVADNMGEIKRANRMIENAVGVLISDAPADSVLHSAKTKQFFVVYKGSNAQVSDHVLIGIKNGNKTMLYDPQTGERFYGNLRETFGRFMAYAVKVD
jgi:hypothetical protein